MCLMNDKHILVAPFLFIIGSFTQTLLLLKRKKADRPYFTLTLGFILRKELQT